MASSFKTTKRAAYVLTIAVLLAGGTGAAQQQYQGSDSATEREFKAILRDGNTILKRTQTCIDEIINSRQYNSPLRKHDHATLRDQLYDVNLAADDEINLLSQELLQVQSCRNSAVNSFSTMAPSVVPTIVGYNTQYDENFRDLILKKQTYAMFFKRNRDLEIAFQDAIGGEAHRIHVTLQQASQTKDEIPLQLDGGSLLFL